MIRSVWEHLDSFPPGRVPLLLVLMAAASGGVVLLRSVLPQPASLTVWTFVHLHSEEFRRQLTDHPEADRIRIQNLGTALFDRLALALMTQTELPNLVEVEQSVIGRFLRGPVEHIPFVDLTERIRREGWDRRCVSARFARYTVGGRIFGVPHDLHPMVLVYRPDVLADLGYRPEELVTWSDWIRAAQTFYRPGELGTTHWRRGLALSTVEGYTFLSLLWQRGGDVFDAAGNVIIDSELAVDTLEFYVSLFRLDPPAAGPALSSLAEDFSALAQGQFLALLAADWMLGTMRLDAAPILAGRVQCRPLPVWEPGGRRTSTVGGTAMLIPTGTTDPDRAWELLKYLYFDRAALIRRFRDHSIVPPLTDAFDDPAFHEEVTFFQGQRVGELLTELAREVPPVNGSPYWPEAYKLLDAVFPNVIAGRQSPRDALAEVAQRLRETIARDQRAGIRPIDQ